MKEYSLAEKLYILRTEKKKTQKEIADYLGIKQAGYSKYETGEAEPKIPTLVKLARYFETDLNDLVGFSPLTPFEKAVNHIKHIAPDSYIKKKDNGEIRCIISRESKDFNLKKTEITVATENDFVTCVNLADKETINALQNYYSDLFVMFFSSALVLMREKQIKEGLMKYGIQAVESDKDKALKRLIKKMGFEPETIEKRKTRSDKRGGKQ